MKKFFSILFLLAVFLYLGGEVMALELKSSAFKQGEYIPKKYSCQGEDMSPEISWSQAPEGTKSFALINDDPDAPMGTWIHWVVYDIPEGSTGLKEGVAKIPSLSDGTKQGMTNFGSVGYGGPCPPPGKAHRYFFKLYALDTALNLKSGLTKAELLKAIKGHVLAEVQLMGLYKR